MKSCVGGFWTSMKLSYGNYFFLYLPRSSFKLLYKTFITVVYVKHFGAVKRNFNYKKPNL